MDRMERFLLAAVLTGLLYGCARPGPQGTTFGLAPKPAPGVFFVATNGNDSWSGRLPAPDGRRTDGPFATLPRALKAVRDFEKSGADAGGRPATVLVGDGLYFVEAPVVIAPEDSGLVLTAYPGAAPVLSG